jgi:predicted house-cleaning NTP pyrophosphatase (Maf/HAM1 superfamily)
VKRVYDLRSDPDYRVLYDARPGVGFSVVVKSTVEIVDRFSSTENGKPRREMMELARQKAREMAQKLDGLVFIGYDPSILSVEMFEE